MFRLVRFQAAQGQPIAVNPAFVVAVAPAADQKGVPLLGHSMLIMANGPGLVVQCGPEKAADRLEAGELDTPDDDDDD